MLIDIAVNLTNRRFRDDTDAVVDAAVAAGVEAMIAVGTDVRHSERARDLARRRPGVVFATAGVHPHDAKDAGPEAMDALRALASDPDVVAIGECGLDHARDYSPRDVQAEVFAEQIELAIELRKPLYLHEREAHRAFVDLLGPQRARLQDAVLHCFTGTLDEAKAYLDLGLHLGVTGWICDERRGQGLREVVRHIPLDRLLLETDAPFLPPRDMKPRAPKNRNEPRFLPHIAHAVADCMGVHADDLFAATTANARRVFGLPPTAR